MPLDICVICNGMKIQVHPHRQVLKQRTKWQPTKQNDSGPDDESRQRSKKGWWGQREWRNKRCNAPRVSVSPQQNHKRNTREIINEHVFQLSTAGNGSKPVCQRHTSLISHFIDNFGFTKFSMFPTNQHITSAIATFWQYDVAYGQHIWLFKRANCLLIWPLTTHEQHGRFSNGMDVLGFVSWWRI